VETLGVQYRKTSWKNYEKMGLPIQNVLSPGVQKKSLCQARELREVVDIRKVGDSRKNCWVVSYVVHII